MTAASHLSVEHALGLPHSIGSRADYLACLCRFYRLYRVLDERLVAFGHWRDFGLDMTASSASARLAADLARLAPGAPLPPDAADAALPSLPTFAHALGAVYVLEGATLGGQVIHRALRAAAIDGVDEASAFFPGDGSPAQASWRGFRAALDAYGRSRPWDNAEVVTGAQRTFASVERWMNLAHWKAA